MTTGSAGINMIKSFESLATKTYICPAGKLTVGYGHTGSDVAQGMHITPEQADQLLENDLAKFESAVNAAVTVPLTQNQFDALVCFCYNVGIGNFRSSTLLRLLNAEDYQGAAQQFVRWNQANGKVLEGLTRRRQAEAALFTSETTAA